MMKIIIMHWTAKLLGLDYRNHYESFPRTVQTCRFRGRVSDLIAPL
jgi:hypothetical protein